MNLSVKAIHRRMPDYKIIKDLYKRLFPREEQFPVILMEIMTAFKLIDAKAFYDAKQLCGFSYVIQQENVLFILYLAVNDKVQNKGYGTAILAYLKRMYPDKTIILDVEEPDDRAHNALQRRRRIEFYKKNGIYETKQFFLMRGVKYEILSTDVNFTKDDYDSFWRNLHRCKNRGRL